MSDYEEDPEIVINRDSKEIVIEYSSYSVVFSYEKDDLINRYYLNIAVFDIATGEEFLKWEKLSSNFFDIIHRFSRIFPLLPDKFATSFIIFGENIDRENGSFLLDLVRRLWRDAKNQANMQGYSESFVHTITQLFEELEDLIYSFDVQNPQILEVRDFLQNCQIPLNLCILFCEWGFREIIHLTRTDELTQECHNTVRQSVLKIAEKNLIQEFFELLYENE